MANKTDISLNTLLATLLGQSQAEVKIRAKSTDNGIALQITAPDLDITTKAQKVYIELDGSEIDIDAGNFKLNYDAGAVTGFERVQTPAPAPSPAQSATPKVRNRGAGCATNERLRNDLG